MSPAVLSAHMHANTLGEHAQYEADTHEEELRAWLASEEAFFAALGVSERLVDPRTVVDPIRIRGIACQLRTGRLTLMSIMQ